MLIKVWENDCYYLQLAKKELQEKCQTCSTSYPTLRSANPF